MASKSTDKTILVVTGCGIAVVIALRLFGAKKVVASPYGGGYSGSEEPEASGYVSNAGLYSSNSLASSIASAISSLLKSLSSSSTANKGSSSGTGSSGQGSSSKQSSSASTPSGDTPTSGISDQAAGPGNNSLFDGLNNYFGDANEASSLSAMLTSGASFEQAGDATGEGARDVLAGYLDTITPGGISEYLNDSLTQDVETIDPVFNNDELISFVSDGGGDYGAGAGGGGGSENVGDPGYDNGDSGY